MKKEMEIKNEEERNEIFREYQSLLRLRKERIERIEEFKERLNNRIMNEKNIELYKDTIEFNEEQLIKMNKMIEEREKILEIEK